MGEQPHYPRVLVVNAEPFHQGTATGLTLCSLFKGWPRDRLATLYCSQVEPDPSYALFDWRLRLSDLHTIHRLAAPFVKRPDAAQTTGQSPGAVRSTGSLMSSCVWRRSVAYLRKKTAGLSLRELDTYRISEDVREAIRRFKPEVIYSMLNSNRILQLVIELSDSLRLPVVPHFMDDWPTTSYLSSPLRQPLRNAMTQRLRAILARSPQRLVIGEEMAAEYRRRYGGNFVPFMCGVERDTINIKPSSRTACDCIRVVYVGALYLKRWLGLLDIRAALERLRDEDWPIECEIYGQPLFWCEGKKLHCPPVMRWAGSLSPAQVPRVLADADILLHVESFDPRCASYTRFSVSSKLPEYFAAGRPILAYGPADLASIRLVVESGAGLVVTARAEHDLVSALRQLAASSETRQRLGHKGIETARQRFDANRQREGFRQALAEAVSLGATWPRT